MVGFAGFAYLSAAAFLALAEAHGAPLAALSLPLLDRDGVWR